MQTPNWTHEFKQAFRSFHELYRFLGFSLSPEIERAAAKWPVFIPRRLAARIKSQGPDGVLAREFLPHADEWVMRELGSDDPIGDKPFHRAPQLIHRYDSRALFAPTTVCPVHCRYCFRKNELNQSDDLFKPEFDLTLAYLKEHPEITEIIFTGGDPLTLSDDRIGFYLEAFSKIPSLKDVRFHTRYPVVFPERITPDFLRVIEKGTTLFRNLTVAIHANHAEEFDAEAMAAINQLSKTGAMLLSQTVFLKGVNDNLEDLRNLMNLFLDLKVRPYYLHHPDQVRGGMHFYLPLEEGRKIYQGLRRSLPGWAIPQYIIDLPGGAGKTQAFNPENHHFSGHLMSLKGVQISVREPEI